jgi:hypothetical protein
LFVCLFVCLFVRLILILLQSLDRLSARRVSFAVPDSPAVALDDTRPQPATFAFAQSAAVAAGLSGAVGAAMPRLGAPTMAPTVSASVDPWPLFDDALDVSFSPPTAETPTSAAADRSIAREALPLPTTLPPSVTAPTAQTSQLAPTALTVLVSPADVDVVLAAQPLKFRGAPAVVATASAPLVAATGAIDHAHGLVDPPGSAALAQVWGQCL